jgi:hypothetical protein
MYYEEQSDSINKFPKRTEEAANGLFDHQTEDIFF